MKIMYFRGKHPNFGDELNTWMWSKILPDFFNNDDKELFIGIGSTIGNHYDRSAKKIIFGTGFVPTYNEKPNVNTDDWDVYFVRGPRTAKMLNISPDLALGDAAILLRTVVDFTQKKPEVVSFMPHWESLERGNWEQVCKSAGINLIDPRRPVEEVMDELFRSKLVICEAMHGAIVSDAFRIPWIPILPIDSIHRDKWYDWAEALDMEIKPHSLLPSSVFEIKVALQRNKNKPNADADSNNNDSEMSSSTISNGENNTTISLTQRLKNFIKCVLNNVAIKYVLNKVIIYFSANKLRKISKEKACLSDDSKINNVTEKMLEKVEQLRRNYQK
jgi:succinoglycan biosynthesis protein ExoV